MAFDPERLRRSYGAHLAELGQRYTRALEEAEIDSLVIHSGAPKPRTEFDDQFWPLRTTPHFAHWLSLVEADCFLRISARERPRLIRVRQNNFWEASAPGEF